MASKAAYVWRGGAKLLYGETYRPGHVFKDEFVMGLHNREALLSAGTLKVEMVDVAPPKEAAASTTKTKSKKPAAKKKTVPTKATKPETTNEVQARVAEAEAADEPEAEPEE